MKAFAAALGRLWHLGGIDLPVAVTLLARTWAIASGLVTVLLIARCL